MRKLVYILLCVCALLPGAFCSAQTQLSEDMQKLVDACDMVRKSISNSNGSSAQLKAGTKQLKECNPAYFGKLTRVGETISSGNHMIYDVDYLQKIIAGGDIRELAKEYNQKPRTMMSISTAGKIFLRNDVVGAKSSVMYKLPVKGHVELAVVAEPGGNLTLKIYDKTHDIDYTEKTSERSGLPVRTRVLDLPENSPSLLIIEVVNPGAEEKSFAIMGK